MSIFIDTESISDIDELKYALKENVIRASKLNKEIEKLKNVKLKEEEEVLVKKETLDSQDISKIEEDLEYEFYYDSIKMIHSCSNREELMQLIREYLPSKSNSNYFNLVSRIKAEIYKEMLELSSMANEDNDCEFLKELKGAISLEQEKLKCVEAVETEKENLKDEVEENRIVFLTTNAGNVYAIEDIEDINREYFESFKELLDSIKKGTFKNVKFFNSNNNKLNMVAEVRGFQTRILFDRVDNNTYVIIQMFIKKCDISKEYKQSLGNRIAIYRSARNEIISLLNDQAYIDDNIKYEEQLNEILDGKVKRKNKGVK